MSKALFFNALPDETSSTGYDRNYNADDLSDFLSIVCDTGVVKTNNDASGKPQGLKVTASGRTITVNAGKAVIKGKAFINEAIETFEVAVNGTSATRYDYVVVRYDNNVSVRNITLELVTGTSTPPTSVANTDRVRELLLAVVSIAPSASTVTVDDKRGTEHCPWFTAVKGYDDYYDAIVENHESTVTLSSITNTVVFTELPSKLYNGKYSLIEVYTNGIKEPETAYTATVTGGYVVVTFTGQKAVGTKVTAIVSNFIDGEGMTTAIAQYTQLLADVANLKASGEYNYICNGVNDNILISNLVKAFLSKNYYHTMRLNVIGNFGFTQMASGTGDISNKYMLFDFGTYDLVPKARVIVDFTKCNEISVPVSNGKYTQIFGGMVIEVVGASVFASNTATDTIIRVFDINAKRVKAVDCRFMIYGYKNCLISILGTFENCYGIVSNETENSYCFLPSTDRVVKIHGGEYIAYVKSASFQSAVVGQSGADAVSILYGVSAPTVARSGYYQTHSLLQWAGGGVLRSTDLISALPLVVVASISEIRGTITKSKTNVW